MKSNAAQDATGDAEQGATLKVARDAELDARLEEDDASWGEWEALLEWILNSSWPEASGIGKNDESGRTYMRSSPEVPSVEATLTGARGVQVYNALGLPRRESRGEVDDNRGRWYLKRSIEGGGESFYDGSYLFGLDIGYFSKTDQNIIKEYFRPSHS